MINPLGTGLSPCLTVGLAVVGSTLVAVPGTVPAPVPARGHAVQLTASHDDYPDLGGGAAFVMGGSTISIPSQRYVDAVDQLYFQPHGFTGEAHGLFTPEGLYPITGVKSLMLDPSMAQGREIVIQTIEREIAAGNVDADHPVVISGWSQSAIISSQVMPELAERGIPSEYVHFVLLGDVSNPAGGFLERFHVPIFGSDPQVPALGITFSGSTPDDLYPTDSYTIEYDGFVDFPRYPINFLADLNAYLGILTSHTAYPILTPEQIANAILLENSDPDSLTNYFMIPQETLPLLAPLTLLPFVGKPMYDLLEPVTRILVNLGYGNIDHGWDDGPANEPTTFGLWPEHLDWNEVFTALGAAVERGWNDFVDDILDPATYDLTNFLNDNPLLADITALLYTLGFTDHTTPEEFLGDLPGLIKTGHDALGELVNFPVSDASIWSSSFTEIVNSLTGTFSWISATLLPIADSLTTLFLTVASVLAGFVAQELADGNILEAIGQPLAAFVGLAPFAAIVGIGVPIVEALGGTLVNLAELVGLGELDSSAAAGIAEALPGLEVADLAHSPDLADLAG